MNQKYRKEDIVALGGELMRQRGYHATGINDILKEAGIPKGSFYNFFPTKEAFGQEVVRWYAGRMHRAMKAIFAQNNLNPLERLKKYYGLLIAGNAEEGFLNGCLVNNFNIEIAGLNDALARETDLAFNQWMDEISRVIEKGQEEGEITDAYPPHDLAEFIHTSFYGAFSRMKSTRDQAPLVRVYQMVFDFLEM